MSCLKLCLSHLGKNYLNTKLSAYFFSFDISAGELRAVEHLRLQYRIVHYVLFTDLIVSLPTAVFLKTADM